MIRVRQATPQGLGFQALAQIPGVTIQSEAVRHPRPSKASTYVAAKASIPAGWAQIDPQPSTYVGMDKWYAEYRRDALVRDCINALAFYSTNKGFETVLEPTKKMSREEQQRFLEVPEYVELKERIDEANKRVNLDRMIAIAIVKSKVHGHSGFEKIYANDGDVEELMPLDSTALDPIVDEEQGLTGFNYKYMQKDKDHYKPEDVLFFTNNQLEADWQGLSDIEPIIHSVETRRIIIQQALKEASYVLWAGIGILNVNTEGMNATDSQNAVNNVSDELAPGKWITTNHKVSGQVYNLEPNLAGLVATLEYCDTDIIGNFRIPRFLLGREKSVNRACYSEDTLTLTENGWKHYWEVEIGEKIATFNPETEQIEYHAPKDLFIYDYVGEMAYFHAVGAVDILVTPEHRMFHHTSSASKNGRWKIIQAKELMKLNRVTFRATGNWVGKEKSEYVIPQIDRKNHGVAPTLRVKMDDWLEFLGYFLSEGGLGGVGNRGGKILKNYPITMAQKNKEKTLLIVSCLDRLQIPYKKYRDGDITRFNIKGGKQLWMHLAETCGKHHLAKRVPRNLMNLSKRQLFILFSALMRGDGYWDKKPNASHGTYYSTSKGLAEDVQEIALKLGLFARIKKTIDKRGNRYPIYRTEICKQIFKSAMKNPNKGMEWQHYNGTVYCFNVPNHLYITSRNGIPTIQGNTAYAELEAFVSGPILDIQRYYRRELERQRIIPLTLKFPTVVTLNIENGTADKCL